MKEVIKDYLIETLKSPIEITLLPKVGNPITIQVEYLNERKLKSESFDAFGLTGLEVRHFLKYSKAKTGFAVSMYQKDKEVGYVSISKKDFDKLENLYQERLDAYREGIAAIENNGIAEIENLPDDYVLDINFYYNTGTYFIKNVSKIASDVLTKDKGFLRFFGARKLEPHAIENNFSNYQIKMGDLRANAELFSDDFGKSNKDKIKKAHEMARKKNMPMPAFKIQDGFDKQEGSHYELYMMVRPNGTTFEEKIFSH